MTVTIKTVSNIKANLIQKYSAVASECCVEKIKTKNGKTEFHFKKEEDAQFFEYMLSNLALDKVN